MLGNEYNKLGGNLITPQHTINLAFTRALLGPMDFTPGGFLNRSPKDFKIAAPTQVMGTRARQLAMTVIYPSPLLVLCDSPANYRGQPGVDFLKIVPMLPRRTRCSPGKPSPASRNSSATCSTVWNVDDDGHDRGTWANNLHHFAQQLFR